MTFELVDLEALGEKALQDFASSMAEGHDREAGFERAVNRLVSNVEFTYAVAAKPAHREPTMEGTVAIWSKMIAICDLVAKEVKNLERQHSACKASFDRILDYRNAAEKRRELHS